MGTGWAVASSTLLGVTVAAVLGSFIAPSIPLLGLALAPLIAGWAYALASAAHGSRTAVVALLAYAASAVLAAIVLVRETIGGPFLLPLATVVLGVVTVVVVGAEARRRRGPIHPGALAASIGLLLISLAAGWIVYGMAHAQL